MVRNNKDENKGDENRKEKLISLFESKRNYSVAEAYKTLRTNLIFTLRKNSCKKIIFTSPAPGEGKSTNCCNLGITLAQTGSKVIIIDCDLRKPDIHKFFDKNGSPGLSEVLAGFYVPKQVITDSGYDNLHLILGGIIPPNPAELLESNAMDELLTGLCKDYEYILLDTPPVNYVTDTLVLTPKVDGVLIVAKEGVTTHPHIKRALASLEFANARILGFILNDVEQKEKYGYGYYGQYEKDKRFRLRLFNRVKKR